MGSGRGRVPKEERACRLTQQSRRISANKDIGTGLKRGERRMDWYVITTKVGEEEAQRASTREGR